MPEIAPPIAMISSTAIDLPEYRKAVQDACLKLGIQPLLMEHMPASPKDAIEESLAMVDRAGIYIGLFAYRYGYIPEGQNLSITHMEYERAIERGLQVLIFIMDESVPVLPAFFDIGKAAQQLTDLKAHLTKNHVVGFYKSPDDLMAQVLHSLIELGISKTTNVGTQHTVHFTDYLHHLCRECQVLPLAQLGGRVSGTRKVMLDDVYISLFTTTPEQTEGHSRQTMDQDEEIVYLTAQAAAAQSTRMVLLGDPGSGKSTFVKQLLVRVARDIIQGNQIPLPIFVTLRDLSPYLEGLSPKLEKLPTRRRKKELAKVVLDYLEADLAAHNLASSAPALRNAITTGAIYLVLDGLDEVPFELREIVRETVEATADIYPIDRLIVTCRVRS